MVGQLLHNVPVYARLANCVCVCVLYSVYEYDGSEELHPVYTHKRHCIISIRYYTALMISHEEMRFWKR